MGHSTRAILFLGLSHVLYCRYIGQSSSIRRLLSDIQGVGKKDEFACVSRS